MVRPVDIIRKEMDSLNQATHQLSEEFNRLYTSYLDSLGMVLRRQVVMATYHLCTQVYPDRFLALSLDQRQGIQRDSRQLGEKANTWLQSLLDPSIDLDLLEPSDQMAGTEAQLPEGQSPEAPAAPIGEPDQDSQEIARQTSRELSDLEEDLRLPLLLKRMVMAALAEDLGEDLGDRLFAGDHLTPTRLAKHHIFLEQQIRDLLQQISKRANHLLQASQVLPKLPDGVLNAASEADVGPSRGRSVPNILNVMVALAPGREETLQQRVEEALLEAEEEAEEEEEEEEAEDETENQGDRQQSPMTHLAAINLRLSDLEFSDVQSSLWRGKLRTALGQLRRLGKHYQKLQRELAISEAEHAWRAIWYDDTGS
ncbi:MAG: hypothetical protein KGQ93_01870 [Cyanobacteria bacterium REEB459]|nr:hypothetical protein [Cyanobacteria bacterium REEB459]